MKPVRSGAARQAGVSVAELRAHPVSDAELEWFFNLAESDMGDVSSFGRLLLPVDEGDEWRTIEDRVEAAHAHRTIRGWLKAIADSDAGVLQAAYVMRPWPEKLYDELGRITGVVVRLACALDRWPEDHAGQERVEMERAQWLESHCAKGCGRSLAPLQKLRREGEVRFARAHRAYGVVRGRRPCLARSS
jgi:hypothetical protein